MYLHVDGSSASLPLSLPPLFSISPFPPPSLSLPFLPLPLPSSPPPPILLHISPPVSSSLYLPPSLPSLLLSIQMVADTAQLAKIADSSIKKLRQQSRRLSPVRELVCLIRESALEHTL